MTLKKGQCPFLKNLWNRTGFKDIPTQTPGVRFPDVEAQFFFFCAARVFWPQFLEPVEAAAKLNDTLPEWLRGSPAK